jgi:hypothetical protein
MNILQGEMRGLIDMPDVVLLKKFSYLSPFLTMMNGGMRFLRVESCGRTPPSRLYTI